MLDTYIGIDPGEHNGVACYDSMNGLRLYTLTFWETIEFIDTMSVKQRTLLSIVPHFYIENPGLNGFIYREKISNNNAGAVLKMAQNVGMNKQDAKRIIERVKMRDMILFEVRPDFRSPKWNAQYFNLLIRGRFQILTSNQHGRDAAKLIAQFWAK